MALFVLKLKRNILCIIITFNFEVSFFNTLCRYSCLISLSSLDGSPGYIVLPPLSTMCLYNSLLISISAA